mmetsp:Transcript_35800/g.83556  ORF Transcript_35800/g.83556 Transcript_35800/m.83556 type:complete len:341 (-) Transcript_35800:1036-2058(-)
MVLATMDSSTGPRWSCSRWISSMITSRTSCVYVRSPDFRVMMSHFSGVVTITCVSAICALVSCWSPVSSRTLMPYGSNRLPKFNTISCTSAFIGATYTILKASSAKEPSALRLAPSSCSIVSIATFVLPAPVGAQRSMFSLDSKAQGKTRDCTRLSVRMPLKAACAHSGSCSMGTRLSSLVKGFGLSEGTCTSSYPFFCTRYDPEGSWHFLFAIKWPPVANASASRSRMLRPTRALPASGTALSMSCEMMPAESSVARMRARSAVSLRTRASSCFVSVKISSVFMRDACSSSSTSACCGCSRMLARSAARSASLCACASRVHTDTFHRCLSSSLIMSNLS